MGLVELARSVALVGGFQKFGRKVSDEAQRMLLPPSFDLAALKGVRTQGIGVGDRC